MPDAFSRRYWRETARTGGAPWLAGSLDMPDSAGPRYRQLADALPILCWFARADGYIEWYNRQWHAYCGSTPDAMQGWGWQAVHDPAALPRVMQGWTRSIASGEPFEMVFPLRGADGVFRPFLTRATPVRDPCGQVAGWCGVNMDVTRQVRAETALRLSEASYGVLTDAMPQMVWSALPDGHHDYHNAQWYAFTGLAEGESDGDGWTAQLHPQERERVLALWQRSLATGDPFDCACRLRHQDGSYRWTLGRALPVRDAEGTILRWIGTSTDIDDAQRAAEQTELLSRELSHRIKNIFAVIGGLIRLSARREPAVRPYAQDLGTRIAALGRAHEFARPHSEASRPAAGETTLHGLLRELFQPYPAFGEQRLSLAGDDVPIDDRGATPVALVFHELATNAAKYGALSVAEGRVAITCRHPEADLLRVLWTESGGPAVAGPPTRQGFGTQLASLSIEQQHGGEIRRAWKPEGLEVELILRPSRLSRGAAKLA